MAELQSVQRVPAGLLELLGMKGTGINPRTLNSELRGAFDVRQMYALNVIASDVDGFNAGALPQSATITVPDTEYWVLMYAVGLCRVDGLTCTWMDGCVQIDLGGGALLPVAVSTRNLGDNSVLPDNFVMQIPFYPPEPWVLRPGGRINAQYHAAIGTANGDVAVQAVFGVLR